MHDINRKKINQELKIKANYFKWDLSYLVHEDSPVMDSIRKLARKYVFKKDLIQDPQYMHLVDSGAVLGVSAKHNLVPTVGRNVIARLLAGDVTFSGEVDYGALGSGNTAFNNASTQLNTEVFRLQASSQAFDDNVAFIDWFVASGDVADQTFEEFGAFIDGTGAADSGQAFSLLITGGWVKSGSMFISAQYTIN